MTINPTETENDDTSTSSMQILKLLSDGESHRMKSYLSSEVFWFLVWGILSMPYFTIAFCVFA